MASWSKARVLSEREPQLASKLEYGAASSGEGAFKLQLPQGTELLWGHSEPAQADHEDQQNPRHSYSDADLKAMERAAWQRGNEEASSACRKDLEQALAAERANITEALSGFAAERDAYYHRMESEVVRLAISIARRVLRRETQVDALALAGVVRVALEKLAHGASVKLQVPATQAKQWRTAVAQLSDLNLAISVEGDSSLSGARCVIVTEMGSTDVSVDAQLEEIERGFCDLLSQRPESGGMAAHR